MKALKGTSMVALLVALFFTPYMAVAQCYTIGCRSFSQSSAGGVPTVVQSQSTGSSGVGTLTLTNTVTPGNVLVATIYGGSAGSTLGFTDPYGNNSTMIASSGLTTDDDTVAVACAPIATGGADTLTFQINGSNAPVIAVVYEVSNATCTQDVTAVHTNTTSATSCNSGPMTTSTANDFLVGVCGLVGTQTATIAAGSGWSGGLNAGNGGKVFLLSEYQVGTSPGSFTATSGTIASEEQATLLVALKP